MSFPFPPSPEVGEQVEGPNGFTYEWNGTGWVTIGGGGDGGDVVDTGIPIVFVITGKPPGGQSYNVPIAIPLRFPEHFAGRRFWWGTPAATAFRMWTLNQISGGVTTELSQFSAGPGSHTSGSLNSPGVKNFAPGDVLQLIAPNPPDSALADVGIAFVAERV